MSTAVPGGWQQPYRRGLAELEAALRSGHDGFGVVDLPAPPSELEALLGLADHAAVWAPAGGPQISMSGVAVALSAKGKARFDRVRSEAATLFEGLERFGDGAAPTPRLYGGCSFQPDGHQDPVWSDFEDAWFFLPRFRHSQGPDGAWLSVAFGPTDDPDQVLRETERLLAKLESPSPPPRPPRLVERTTHPAAERWMDDVESIRTAIQEGRIQKVVAARRARLQFSGPLRPETVVERLRRETSRCTIFAFRSGASTFLGATPERLVARQGRAVETEALAGSISLSAASSADPTGARLLESPKDQVEHQFVVRDVVDGLRPLCDRIELPDEPTVHPLRHVAHLRTPISATLRGDTHVLELVDRLHPTPAVGGVPKPEAIRWIADHEASRGWYAAPVGWFDAEGNGEFDVALRSGVVHGAEAHLYAGAGIVRDSDPASELAETEIKLKALLSALDAES